MARSCENCSAHCPDGTVICRRCVSALRRDLRAAPGLLADLEVTLTRQDRLTPPGAGHGGGTPVPWSEPARSALDALTAELTWWAEAQDPVAGAVCLLGRLRELAGSEWTPERAQRLSARVSDARRVVDVPDILTRFPVGPCPLPGAEAPGRFCVGVVWAHLPRDGGAYLQCRIGEAHRWPPERWLRAGRLIARRAADLNTMAPA